MDKEEVLKELKEVFENPGKSIEEIFFVGDSMLMEIDRFACAIEIDQVRRKIIYREPHEIEALEIGLDEIDKQALKNLNQFLEEYQK